MALIKQAANIFYTGVSSVVPQALVRQCLSLTGDILKVSGRDYPVDSNVYVVGFGKAVLGMASAVESILGKHFVKGIVSVPAGLQESLRHSKWHLSKEMLLEPSTKISVHEAAAHNLPDKDAVAVSKKMVDFVKGLRESDVLIVLVSGGGSALFCLPVEGVTIQEKQLTISSLSRAGASISELNTVRTCLSQVKGGRFAGLIPTYHSMALVLSDIVGNPLEFIASGPTVTPCTNLRALQKIAVQIIDKYKLKTALPASINQSLSTEVRCDSGHVGNCKTINNVLIGSNHLALDSMRSIAKDMGYHTSVLTDAIEGEASEVGQRLVEMALCILTGNCDYLSHHGIIEYGHIEKLRTELLSGRTVCLLLGGETTVSVKGDGRGGRNQELALAAAIHFDTLTAPSDTTAGQLISDSSLVLLSCGSDGQDGPTSAAGAVCCPSVVPSAQEHGLDAWNYLKRNDSNSFFQRLEQGRFLIETGLTGTNVMDLIVLLLRK